MARPLRFEFVGGLYHVTSRGNERRDIYRDARDREHFLELLADLPKRFGTRLHAYVLMPNHYHLVVETPEGNLSRAIQWLNLSYSVWFNLRHERTGHLFRGRFHSIVIEGDAGLQEVGRYVHLNPVRVRMLGMGKEQRAAQRQGAVGEPSAKVVKARLETLRGYRWSSYRGYAGYAAMPAWVHAEKLGQLSGGSGRKECQLALRAHTEEPVRQGLPESPWERLVGGIVLGTDAFARELLARWRGKQREQPAAKRLREPLGWPAVVRAVENEKGERWKDFRDRHADWGRDLSLWLGRREARMRLAELAEVAGGLDYAAVAAAVKRMERRLEQDQAVAECARRVQAALQVLRGAK